ncbi:MAG: DUF4157 domain-containing protein [Anaerolineae bacterium]|nr:DUF4157 domain-containing protein [Anaerolineae bacterium]
MAKEHLSVEEKKGRVRKPESHESSKEHASGRGAEGLLGNLPQVVGNQAIQRLIAQRSGDGPTELDDDTANRINRERGGGQALDSGVQEQMGGAMGQDFSGVTVHTSQESDDLNRQLGSKAFTTGKDIFFREGNYEPHSSSGQELIAHELTHVAQQGAGRVHSGGQMAVNAPGDSFEQEADAFAKTATAPAAMSGVQRQEEEEEAVQAQEEEEEAVQAQEEEEEEVQAQEEEEEEEVQAQEEEEEEEEAAQTQEMEEEEEAAAS